MLMRIRVPRLRTPRSCQINIQYLLSKMFRFFINHIKLLRIKWLSYAIKCKMYTVPVVYTNLSKGDLCMWIWIRIRRDTYVLYSALLHQPPLRFHCADGCWDRTQDRCNCGSEEMCFRKSGIICSPRWWASCEGEGWVFNSFSMPARRSTSCSSKFGIWCFTSRGREGTGLAHFKISPSVPDT